MSAVIRQGRFLLLVVGFSLAAAPLTAAVEPPAGPLTFSATVRDVDGSKFGRLPVTIDRGPQHVSGRAWERPGQRTRGYNRDGR